MAARARSSWSRPTADPALVDDLARVWAGFAAAVADRASPLRLPVVATVAADGAAARTMVLRAVDAASATLTFFTDARAVKVGDLVHRVAVVAYDADARWQIRLTGEGAVVTAGAAADAYWSALPPASRVAYATVAAPGTPLARPEAVHLPADEVRANFAVLIVTVDRLDTLDLAIAGHRRVRHDRRAGCWVSTWLVP